MVQILPQFDPGSQVGQGFGGGASQALNMLGQRNFQNAALDQLKSNLGNYYENVTDPNTGRVSRQMKADTDPLSLLADVYKATAGVPGLSQSFTETIAPLLMNRLKANTLIKPVDKTNQRDNQGNQGGQNSDGNQGQTGQLQGQQGSGQGTPMQEGSPQNLSQAPQLGDRPPAFNVPNFDQYMQSKGQSIVDAGGSYQDVLNSYNAEVEQGKAKYAADLEAYNAAKDQLATARTLEDEQRKFVDSKAADWQGEKGITPGQFYSDFAYKAFDEERKANPKLTDQQVWAKTKAKLDNFHNAEANLQKITPQKVMFSSPGERGKINKPIFQNGYQTAQNAIKAFGDTPEIRERLVSDLMQNGWEEDYARSMVNAPSKELRDWISDVDIEPVVPNKETDYSVGSFLKRYGYPPLAPNDDISVLRNRIALERHYPAEVVNEVIVDMNEKGMLSDYQKSQLPKITNSPTVKPYYLFDIFQNNRPGKQSPEEISGSQLPWDLIEY